MPERSKQLRSPLRTILEVRFRDPLSSSLTTFLTDESLKIVMLPKKGYLLGGGGITSENQSVRINHLYLSK